MQQILQPYIALNLLEKTSDGKLVVSGKNGCSQKTQAKLMKVEDE
jgi:hypothetical protein